MKVVLINKENNHIGDIDTPAIPNISDRVLYEKVWYRVYSVEWYINKNTMSPGICIIKDEMSKK